MAEVRQNKREIERWGIFELELTGPSDGNPFKDVLLSVQFQFRNRIVELDGFYDGDGIYRVRFMPDRQGRWTYVTKSNRSELAGHTGDFVCVEPSAHNHGPVRVKDKYHFAYEDGTPYLPFGTTCYHWTHQGNEELEEMTLESLKRSPFNKVRMCLLPTRDMQPSLIAFAGTEPGNVDKESFNPSFFAHFERRLRDLMAIGVEADLVLFHPYDKGHWGFDNMEPEQDQFYLRYAVARFGAFRNVWWSLSNEYDFNKFKSVDDWDALLQFVEHHDPYQHLRSIHNGTKMYKISSLYDFTKPWITHQSIQHWDAGLTAAWLEACPKPVVIDEISYEGDSSRRWGNISGQELTHRFWDGVSQGGYVGHGESFIDRETRAWISSGGRLYGESVERIAFLRKIMEGGPQDLLAAEREGQYMLVYFGVYQHAYRELALPEKAEYGIELIDTWKMTITPVEGLFSGKTRIDLPGKPYMALRIKRVSEVRSS